MLIYTFWNNKGGTGKTSLGFQTACTYAYKNQDKNILVIDVCPQANMSELLLGGLQGAGSENLLKIQGEPNRPTIGGYFQSKLSNPYEKQNTTISDYVKKPIDYNKNIPNNISLISGDPLLELQSNAISTLSNTQLPGINTWIKVIEWISDLLSRGEAYDVVFIDTNPSFSIYTQMALASTENLILPVMSDDSSRRALQNAFSLIYGFKLPHPFYQQYAFANKLKEDNKPLPKIHLILKNRLTQYMGAASAYNAVLKTIESEITNLLTNSSTNNLFNYKEINDIFVDIRDFQTTGVVAHARGCPFYRQETGSFTIQGRRITIKRDYLENCRKTIDEIVEKL